MLQMLLALALIVLSPAASIAQQPETVSRDIPAGVVVTRGIVYAEYGERRLLLDLYLPAERASGVLPLIVTIPGGGVQVVDKEDFAHVAAALAQRGFAAVNTEYRPLVEARFPAGVEDARAAVRWARANAQTWGFNTDAIGAIGGSMGGYLAAYLGLTGDVEEGEDADVTTAQSSAISAIVAMAPPTDFSAIETHPTFIAILGRPFDEDPALWRFASAVSHVGPESPPALLMHSATDRAVPVAQSIALARRYAEANLPVELVVLPDAGHAFWNYETWFDDTMNRAAAFFGRNLGNQ